VLDRVEHVGSHFRLSLEVKKKKINNSNHFLFEIYTTLLSLFSIVRNSSPHWMLKSQLPVISKRRLKLAILIAFVA
jgi:hypothetical protein